MRKEKERSSSRHHRERNGGEDGRLSKRSRTGEENGDRDDRMIGIAPIAARRIAGAVAGTGSIATRVGITAAARGATEIGRANGVVVAGREDTMEELTGNWRDQGVERGRGNENLRGR